MSRTCATLQEMVQSWFLEWLMGHMNVSPRTVESYRDSFRLLFRWLESERGVRPSEATFEDVGRDAILAFMAHLRDARGCKAKTVNCRLGAIRSFAEYVSCECPERSGWAYEISTIRQRSEERPALDYLTPDQVSEIADACDPSTPEGRRDAMMVMLLFNTGFRVSELVGLRASSLEFGDDGRCRATVVGKGRKERTVPLWPETSASLRAYLDEAGISGDGYVFPGRKVGHLTRSGARSSIDRAVARAAASDPALASKRVTPHVFRHSCAMAMLAADVDLSTIAIWLGHEDVSTTHKYMVASMDMKEEALERYASQNPFAGKEAPRGRYVPDDSMLAFLDSL